MGGNIFICDKDQKTICIFWKAISVLWIRRKKCKELCVIMDTLHDNDILLYYTLSKINL